MQEIDLLDYLLIQAILRSYEDFTPLTAANFIQLLSNPLLMLDFNHRERVILNNFNPFDLAFIDLFLDPFLIYLEQYSLGSLYSFKNITHMLALKIYSISKLNFDETLRIKSLNLNQVLVNHLI